MKVVILAGGLGTRLSEETVIKPKPMVEIGGAPILWHIMKLYSAFGFNEFVVALGYRGDVIKDYFVNYRFRSQSLTVDVANGRVKAHGKGREDWVVHLLDTGDTTQTGGRVKRAAEFIGRESFMMTYGDGLSAIDVAELREYHKAHGKLATVTAVRPPARFGEMRLEGPVVAEFREKPQISEGWINGGFLVLEPGVVDYIAGDETIFEREPLERLAADGQVNAYRFQGFWQCMDTLRDKRQLNTLWETGDAPWKRWR